MSEYVARHESCITPSAAPDANLRAYAAENGLQPALVAAKFSGTQKLYSYWGHTGMKSGDIVKVLVPRRTITGGTQEETEVRVWSVIPALGFTSTTEGAVTSHKRSAKHAHSIKRSASKAISYGSNSTMLQSWYIQALRDLEPLPKTEHAKACVGEIDGMLNNGDAVDYKVKIPPEYYAVMEHKPLEEVRKMFQCDFEAFPDPRSELIRQQGEAAHRQMEKQLRLGEMYGNGSLAMRDFSELEQHAAIQHVIDSYRVKTGQTAFDARVRSGRMVGPASPDNLPRLKRYRPMFRLSELTDFGPCGRQPKETPMSAKIENVTYVTLPSGARYDAKSMSAQQFFDAIAALEKEVAKLDGVSHKPRALKQRIAELNVQIQQLSDLCDSLHAAKEEPKTDSLGVPYGNSAATPVLPGDDA